MLKGAVPLSACEADRSVTGFATRPLAVAVVDVADCCVFRCDAHRCPVADADEGVVAAFAIGRRRGNTSETSERIDGQRTATGSTDIGTGSAASTSSNDGVAIGAMPPRTAGGGEAAWLGSSKSIAGVVSGGGGTPARWSPSSSGKCMGVRMAGAREDAPGDARTFTVESTYDGLRCEDARAAMGVTWLRSPTLVRDTVYIRQRLLEKRYSTPPTSEKSAVRMVPPAAVMRERTSQNHPGCNDCAKWFNNRSL